MYKILKADISDIDVLLRIKKEAFLQQASIYNTMKLTALLETKDDFMHNFDTQIVLKALTFDNTTCGSVRIREEGRDAHIGSLCVMPIFQRKGIGETLLLEAEKYVCDQIRRFVLFTGHKSTKNLELYAKNGYKEFSRKSSGLGFDFVFMEKMR